VRIPRILTGFERFDRVLGGLHRSDLLILAARPGLGKTSLALSVAYDAAVKQGAYVAVFSLEMSKDQLVERLLSAEAGLYAGDVIAAVNGKKINDLKSFRLATKDVAQSNRANLSVYRGGKYINIVVFSTEALGIAQMEAAPMILATAKSPHGYYGPCDRCHAISKTALNSNQLLKDQGDALTKVAPNIRMGTPPPHRNRGTCTKCHVVL